MSEKIKVKDGGIQLKIGGALGVVLAVLGLLSIGYMQSSGVANLLTPEQLAFYTEPSILFTSYWFSFCEIIFGVFAFYFASHPEKNVLCQSFAIGFVLCYIISSFQIALGNTSFEERIIMSLFMFVPITYYYGGVLQ